MRDGRARAAARTRRRVPGAAWAPGRGSESGELRIEACLLSLGRPGMFCAIRSAVKPAMPSASGSSSGKLEGSGRGEDSAPRGTIRWRKTLSKPLAGKRMVVTRAAGTSRRAGCRARSGWERKCCCCRPLRSRRRKILAALDAAIAHALEFDWILFTSQNAVRFFARHLAEHHRIRRGSNSPRSRGPQRWARRRLKRRTRKGFAWITWRKITPANRSRANSPRSFEGSECCCRAATAPTIACLPRCARAGAEVTEVIAYRTAAPKAIDPHTLQRVRRAEVDAIIFASPSAFHNL